MKRTYYHELNLPRIVAAAYIAFFYHYLIIFGYAPGVTLEGSLDTMCFWAYMAVEIFFTISGFVMYHAYAEKIQKDEIGCKRYTIDRVKRIYPTMILSVCVMAAIQWSSRALYGQCSILDLNDGRNSIKAFILSILGLSSGWFCDHDQFSINGATWFISIIMMCYVIFYCLMRYVRDTRARNVCFVLIQMVGIFLLWHPLNLPLLYKSCGRGYLDFFCGVMLAQSLDKLQGRHARLVVPIGAGMVLVYALVYGTGIFPLWETVGSVMLNSGILLMLMGIPFCRQISDNRIVRLAADLSFDIYLWNLPTFAGAVFLMRTMHMPYLMGGFAGWMLVVIGNVFVAILAKKFLTFFAICFHYDMERYRGYRE